MTRRTISPERALKRLGAIWSPDFGAYASGQLDASRVRCVLCEHPPRDCPPFGTAEYSALMDACCPALKMPMSEAL
jgi:hypothetical protein